MSKTEKIIKNMFYFWVAVADSFSFYILTIGLIVLYAFSVEIKLLEILNLTMVYQFYIVLFSIYLISKETKYLFLYQTIRVGEVIVSLLSFLYLALQPTNPYWIMSGFIASFTMKMLIIAFVKIKKYPEECLDCDRYK